MTTTRKSYKIWTILFLVLALICPIVLNSCANGSDGDENMEADKYVMNVTIDENGDMHVVEEILIDNFVEDYNNYFYKQIAYNKNNMFGNSSTNKSFLREDVKVTVKDASGIVYDSEASYNNYPYHFMGFSYEGDKDERGDAIKCEGRSYCDMIFYYNKPGMARYTTFIYEYTIEGVITQYNDISEFNWVLLDYQPFSFNDITINVTLPDGDYNIEEESTFFHGTNMAKVNFKDNNVISITADNMISNEQIEVRLLLDNTLFSGVEDINKVNIDAQSDILRFEEEQDKNARIEAFLGVAGTIIVYALFIVGLCLLAVYFYRKYDKEYKSDFYNEYYRELPASYPPAVMGYLYKFREIDDDDLSASLLDLIRRKYLILETEGITSGYNEKDLNYTIKLNAEKSQDDLTQSEKFLITWFISEMGDGKQVTNSQLENFGKDYASAKQYNQSSKSWYDLVKSEAKKYKFFEKDAKGAKKKFNIAGVIVMIIAIISLTSLSLAADYYLGLILAVSYPLYFAAYSTYISGVDRRSKQGNEDYVRWNAFKKFLEDFSTFEDYPLPSIIIWEHYLVYATSFGIADKVSEQLKLKLDLNDLIDADTTFVVYFGFEHRIRRFNRTISSMRFTSNASIATHDAMTRASNAGRRGGFGGGGFSGGSSFGGGGGSFGGGRR